MNYRHSFHAGNFADLVKHALVLWLVREGRPSVVLDTHAGAGLYDLSGDGARSKEAEAGVARLMTAEGRPPLMDALADRVAGFNPEGGVRFYPGSPAADRGRPGARRALCRVRTEPAGAPDAGRGAGGARERRGARGRRL
ncbi:23S rRNA (adenine(2030)-N(6))-methyltransferase RlmJ [Brevundimonas sp.]|uniref:23S rRNA (adenine(2030)-N(6))-methyltransferase RlmJ n=1 Tax=Brevundimonas sp. TaxID=1871086 RepID=UPI003BA9C5DD